MSVRERHSKNVCIWITDTGQPNEVSHLWVYKDLNHRAEARAAAADPDWKEFLKDGPDRLDEMHASTSALGPLSVEVGTLTLIQLVNMFKGLRNFFKISTELTEQAMQAI